LHQSLGNCPCQEVYSNFFPTIDNTIAVLDSFVYDPKAKQVSRKVNNKVKVIDDVEDLVTKDVVLLDDTAKDPIFIVSAGMALF